ncbi:MAG: hypothetical protein Fur0019_18890 [Tibeticola sp.]
MDGANSAGRGLSAQAELTIEGEEYAAAFLKRLRSGDCAPGELTSLVVFLDGAMLNGFCRAIERALEAAS